jgi:hypothetical protein
MHSALAMQKIVLRPYQSDIWAAGTEKTTPTTHILSQWTHHLPTVDITPLMWINRVVHLAGG